MDTRVGESFAPFRRYFFRLSGMPLWRMYLSLLLAFGIPYWFCAVVYSVFTGQILPGGIWANVLATLAKGAGASDWPSSDYCGAKCQPAAARNPSVPRAMMAP